MVLVAIAFGVLVGVAIGAAGLRWLDHRRSPAGGAPPASAATLAPVALVPDESSDAVARSLRDAVDHLEVGVVLMATGGAVRFRNTAALAWDGTHVGVIVEERMREAVAGAAAGDRAASVVELHGPPKQWLEIAVDPLPDDGAVVTIRDITERVRSDSVRTDFVTNVSHELKTPVGALAVLAEALLDEDDREIVDRVATRLVTEAHRAVQTIDDLLALSQIEGARPSDEIVDVNLVVDRALERGRAAAAGRSVEITQLDPPPRLLVRGDDAQLVSAVGNLVENAVKYSHDGGVVQVRTRVDDNAVEVMVADQGIGIPARDLDRVFERFYRVDRARSRATGGSGLGLSIVRHVATNHGGEVSVSSQEGEGSTFVFRLPAARIVQPVAGETPT